MATIPNPAKSRTWDLGTSANGTFFDTEFNQLYENDNDLDGRLEVVEANYVSDVPRAEFMADTHAGYGATATKIPYYTNTRINVDTAGAMTVENNSTDGCKATINAAGRYAVTYWSDPNAIGDSMGISVNGTPTTNIQSITASQRRCYGQCAYPSAGLTVSTVLYLEVGDVVRPHADAHAVVSADLCGFSICRVA